MFILTYFALAPLGSHFTNYIQWPPSSGTPPVAIKSSKVKLQPKILPYDPKHPTPMFTGDSSDMLKIYQHHFAPPKPEQKRLVAEITLEYDQILQLEKAGRKQEAVRQMKILGALDKTGTFDWMSSDRLRIDREELGDFKDIFVPIESVKMQLNMPGYPGPEFWTLEAATGAELGYVFRGERTYLESIWKGRSFADQNLKKIDFGDDPRSIAILAWSTYELYVPDTSTKEEWRWIDRHLYDLDPSSDFFYFGSFGDRFETEPKAVLSELASRFPQGPPKDLANDYNSMVDSCNWYIKHPVDSAK